MVSFPSTSLKLYSGTSRFDYKKDSFNNYRQGKSRLLTGAGPLRARPAMSRVNQEMRGEQLRHITYKYHNAIHGRGRT